MKFPFIHQQLNNDCGPTCLQMIARYYGTDYELEFLKKKWRIKETGVSMLNIYKTARTIGLRCRGVKMKIEGLKQTVQNGPVIIHQDEIHFAIVYKAPKSGTAGYFYVADPAQGLVRMNEINFSTYWISKKADDLLRSISSKKISDEGVGYALLLEPV